MDPTLRPRLIAALKAEMPALSPQLRQAAKYVIDHPSDFGLDPIRVSARKAGVSTYTLVKISKYMGFSGFEAFRLVTLPIIAPAVISGWLLAFTLSLDDLVIASFATGPGATTLPMKIYSQVRLGVTPEINAVSTILVGIVAVGVLIASLVAKQQEIRRQRDEQMAAAGGS